MRDLRYFFVIAIASLLGISGCNSNLSRYLDPSESMIAGRHRHYSPNEDLWVRLRDGMSLEIPDDSRVDQFVKWYTEHPAFLDVMQSNAELYLYHIVEKLDERGLPYELALLPAVESNYTPTAQSHAGAVGMWQFISSTGKIYGLDQNPWFDERRHPFASTDAALDYLTKLHDMFGGDWELAIAAYNAGEGAVGRARTANENKHLDTDFWSLDLPQETEEYVPRLLALASIVKKPQRYGVTLAHIPNRPRVVEVQTQRTLDLEKAAERCGLDKKEFCKLNAAYLTAVTTSRSNHRILVPADKADELAAVLEQLPEISAPPPSVRGSDVVARTSAYQVKSGDTLTAIASRFGVSVNQLKSTNNMKGSTIKVGQTIKIKGGKATSSPTRTAKLKVDRTYNVRSGDTLWSIARSHNISLDALCRHNGLSNKSVLKPGQSLKIPSLRQAKADSGDRNV